MKPIQGKTYVTQTGDTYPSIAGEAYGDTGKSDLIKQLNPTQLTFEDADQIAEGQQILIPVDNPLAELRQAQLNRGLAQ